MPRVRCLICGNPALTVYVNGLLNEGFTNAGIAAGVIDMGGKLDPDVVGRHKAGHWVRPERQTGPRATKTDLARKLASRAEGILDNTGDEALVVFSKELMPVIRGGLAAEVAIDKRELNDKRLGLAAGALSLQAWLSGLGTTTAPPPELDDGRTIEGEAVEV